MRILCAVCLVLFAAAVLHARADDQAFVMLGQDRLEFPKEFAVPSQGQQKALKKDFRNNPRRAKDLGPNCPFLDSVEFSISSEVVFGSMFDVEPSALLRCDTEVCARPSCENLGYFLKPLETRAQFEAAIAVLNKLWLDRSLDAAQFRNAIREIKADKRKLPLEILQTEVDERTLSKRGFAKDRVWYAHFVFVDGASIIEHKYAIDARNRIAHKSRVLVKGPSEPPFSDPRNDFGISIVVGCPQPESAVHRTYRACSELLRRAAFLDQWKRELSDPSAARRIEAAQDISCLFDAAAGAEPELTKALADVDSRVRYFAAESLEQIGPSARIAVPALFTALHDRDTNVRSTAARAIFEWGARDARIEAAKMLAKIGSYSSITVLKRGLTDQDADVRAAAAAAIEAIERESSRN